MSAILIERDRAHLSVVPDETSEQSCQVDCNAVNAAGRRVDESGQLIAGKEKMIMPAVSQTGNQFELECRGNDEIVVRLDGASPELSDDAPASVAKTAIGIVLNLLFKCAQSRVIPECHSLQTVLNRE